MTHAVVMSVEPERASFVRWARGAMVPLGTQAAASLPQDFSSFGEMVGDATVVALSEAAHGAAEPLEFRNQVLEYLVREKGFTAIAIESGSVESRIVHDYVRGGCGDLCTVVRDGISWTMDQLPQNRALVHWLRDYNANAGRARPVNFYGFDVPGSPGNPSANRGIDTALVEALRYLDRVDRPARAVLGARLDALLAKLRFDLRRPAEEQGYDQLAQDERDALTAGICDVISLLERGEASYVAASTAHDYEWAYRAAIGARQVDEWLRQIPNGWRPSRESLKCRSEEGRFLSAAIDVRDRAQADNLDWILRQEGLLGKVLVFAHRYHLSAAPVKEPWWLPSGKAHAVMGTYLRRRLGRRLLTIGNLIRSGSAQCGAVGQILEEAPPRSIDGLAGEVGVPAFLLDLRAAPSEIRAWLEREHAIGQGEHILELSIGQAFDVLFYLDRVTPACIV